MILFVELMATCD